MDIKADIGSNTAKIEFRYGELFFSYRTLVGVLYDGKRYRTNEYHSTTTSKHLNGAGYKDAVQVSPDELERLAAIAVTGGEI